MKIIIAANYTRYEFKEKLKQNLEAKGHIVIDLSAKEPDDSVWTIKAGRCVANAMKNIEAERAIVICGTGMGISIATNKNKGARCAMVESYWAAMQSRIINNANIMAIGSDVVGLKLACDMADVFIETEFLQGISAGKKAKYLSEFEELNEYEDLVFKSHVLR